MSVADEIIRLQTAKADIKNAIEEKGVTIQETELLNEYPSKIDEVYEAGKDAEADMFWGGLLNKGNPTRLAYAFYGWNRDIFYPRYNIVCNHNMAGLFQFFEQGATKEFDLSARLKECGVVLDTSQAPVGAGYSFYYTGFSKIPTVDFTGIEDGEKLNYAFANNYNLKEIEKIICKETNVWNVTFQGSSLLEELRIEGVIGRNGFDVRHCTKLSHDSLMSIINALKDYREDTSGTTYTIYLGTTNLAKLTDSEKAIATEKGWSLA